MFIFYYVSIVIILSKFCLGTTYNKIRWCAFEPLKKKTK